MKKYVLEILYVQSQLVSINPFGNEYSCSVYRKFILKRTIYIHTKTNCFRIEFSKFHSSYRCSQSIGSVIDHQPICLVTCPPLEDSYEPSML